MKIISFKLGDTEIDKKLQNLYKEVKNVAKNKGVTVKAVIVEALQHYLQLVNSQNSKN